MQRLCDDLAAEHADLDAIVAGLDEPSWEHPTPARGWAVRDQISHLGYFDRTAVLAGTEPVVFSATVAASIPRSSPVASLPRRSCWPGGATAERSSSVRFARWTPPPGSRGTDLPWGLAPSLPHG